MSKIIDGVEYYEQVDLDNIVAKAKKAQSDRYEKTHIEVTKYKELENKVNEMSFVSKKESFKETFKANGGDLESYEDFIALNKDLLTMEPDQSVKALQEIKTQKKHFFVKDSSPSVSVMPNDQAVVEELLNGNNNEFVEGTIYRINSQK